MCFISSLTTERKWPNKTISCDEYLSGTQFKLITGVYSDRAWPTRGLKLEEQHAKYTTLRVRYFVRKTTSVQSSTLDRPSGSSDFFISVQISKTGCIKNTVMLSHAGVAFWQFVK